MYDWYAYDFVRNQKPSDRGELEITDLNNYYVKCNNMESHVLEGFWTDAGTFESLQKATELVSKSERLQKEMEWMT